MVEKMDCRMNEWKEIWMNEETNEWMTDGFIQWICGRVSE